MNENTNTNEVHTEEIHYTIEFNDGPLMGTKMCGTKHPEDTLNLYWEEYHPFDDVHSAGQHHYRKTNYSPIEKTFFYEYAGTTLIIDPQSTQYEVKHVKPKFVFAIIAEKIIKSIKSIKSWFETLKR